MFDKNVDYFSCSSSCVLPGNVQSCRTQTVFFSQEKTSDACSSPAVRDPLAPRPSKQNSPSPSTSCTQARNALELADALERYKLIHRRPFLSFEEMLVVLESLGYRKDTDR